MRLAMVVDSDTMTSSGPGLLLPDTSDRVVALAGALAERGHTTRIYAPTDEPAEPKRLQSRVTLQPVPLGDVNSAREPAEFGDMLAGEWRRSRPELTHVFGPRAGMAVAAARRETPMPVVQDTRYDAPASDGEGDAWARLELALGRAADRVVVTDGREASMYALQGVPRTAIDVVPYAVDLEVFNPEGPALERDGKPRVGLLLDPTDAGQLLSLRAHLPEADTVLLDATGETIEGVEDEVVPVWDDTDQQRRAELLRSLDLLVVGASWASAGPACEEAMACGVPLVVAGDGETDDAVLDGVTGAVVPAGRPRQLVETVWQLLHNEVRRTAFGIAAADRAASCFTWLRVARDMEASYDTAVRAGRYAGRAITGSYARRG